MPAPELEVQAIVVKQREINITCASVTAAQKTDLCGQASGLEHADPAVQVWGNKCIP